MPPPYMPSHLLDPLDCDIDLKLKIDLLHTFLYYLQQLTTPLKMIFIRRYQGRQLDSKLQLEITAYFMLIKGSVNELL